MRATGPSPERRALVARVRALKATGLTHLEVGAILGISRSYISDLLADPDGARARRRRDSYRGVCEICGAGTDGSNGRAAAPRFCADHAPLTNKIWDRESIIEALQRWAREQGRQPTATDWKSSGDRAYPACPTVQAYFGSWNEGLLAAGFPPRRSYDRAGQGGTAGMSNGQWLALNLLEEMGEPVHISALAGAMDRSRPAAHSILTSLRERGLVEMVESGWYRSLRERPGDTR